MVIWLILILRRITTGANTFRHLFLWLVSFNVIFWEEIGLEHRSINRSHYIQQVAESYALLTFQVCIHDFFFLSLLPLTGERYHPHDVSRAANLLLVCVFFATICRHHKFIYWSLAVVFIFLWTPSLAWPLSKEDSVTIW